MAGRRKRYSSYKHATKRLGARKMKIGKASKFCSARNGYTTKTARKDCMKRRMSGQFAGRR